jgi:hypothetical protein
VPGRWTEKVEKIKPKHVEVSDKASKTEEKVVEPQPA